MNFGWIIWKCPSKEVLLGEFEKTCSDATQMLLGLSFLDWNLILTILLLTVTLFSVRKEPVWK